MKTNLLPTVAAWLLVSALGLVVCGCATTAPTTSKVTIPALGKSLPHNLVPDSVSKESSQYVGVEPTGDLTLREALSAALTNNPKLLVFAWENRAREAESLQAGFGPNPELDLELENFGGSGDNSSLAGSETTLVMSQIVELGGKRKKRVALAEQAQGLSAWDYETARLDVLTEVTQKFVATLVAQENVTLAAELVEHAQEMLNSVQRQVRAGSTSAVEENRARVTLTTSRIEESKAEHALTIAKKQLSATWGSVAPNFETALGDLSKTQELAPLSLLQERLAANPETARWDAELAYRQAAITVNKSLSTVDVSLGGGLRYFSESDDVAFVVNVGVPLQLNDYNKGAILAAEARLQRTEAEKTAATVEMIAALSVTYQLLLANESEIASLRDLALPEAEKALSSAHTSYLRGAIRFTDVLDTERMYFALKQRYFEVLATHHTTVAKVERLTGAAMDPKFSPTRER